ncbi:hypothetical protein F4808DRAFT_343851 [Astrocystis sublimbata]|nr:hypothetical protein F4808DRAFT_343851 [Astrocystis sublimbata]
MSSTGDSSSSLWGDTNGDPAHHPPWPRIDPSTQRLFEIKFLAKGATISFGQVPKLQVWAPLFGLSDGLRVRYMLSQVKMVAEGARRPLSGEEATAFCQHTAHAMRIFAWSGPFTCMTASVLAYSGRKTWNFPLYKPKMKRFDPLYFPSKNIPLLRGVWANSAWHIVRLFAWMPMMWIPILTVFASAGGSSMAAHVKRDPRLLPVMQEISKNHGARQIPGVRAGNARKNQQRPVEAHQGDQTPQDHGNTSGATQSNTTYERSGSVGDLPQNAYSGWSRDSSTQQAASYEAQSNTSPSIDAPREDNDADPLFEHDDASPVAPSARKREMSSASSSSTWGQIRQQNRPGAPNWERGDSSGEERGWAQLRQDKAQTSRDSSPKTESYTYTSTDEQKEARNYEKEQAQKEFDALLDAERRGGGSSGGGRQR